MNRVPVLTAYLLALILLGTMTGLVGCSKGESSGPATTPSLKAESTPPLSPTGESVTLGYYQLVFDDNSVTVEEASPVRGAEFDVTPYATFIIEDFYFDQDLRNWYVTATIKNISPFTGYDVWAVFHSMGNKFLINQDGFTWALPPIFPTPTRVPFICYGKQYPNRQFAPMAQDTRTIVIHQPEGIPKLAPIGFWIDATINPRQNPGVEDLHVEPIDATHYNLTAYVWDHQSPSANLIVYADTTNFNGNNYEPMYDDGAHGDGAAGDNIFGANFSGDPEDGFYVLTVYAFDPQQHQGENDVGFWHGDEIPCDLPIEHWPFETLDKGEWSGITTLEEVVVNDMATFEMLWMEHTSFMYPPPPHPYVDFEHYTLVAVFLGDRPSNNHFVTIQHIKYDPCEDLVYIYYQYTPHTACGPLDVITDPFHMVLVPKFDSPAYFMSQEVDCPGPPPECVEPLPFEQILHGNHSGIHEPYELRISGPDQFEALWSQHVSNMYPPPEPPHIFFENHDLIAVGLGNRPTSGYDAKIYKICMLADQTIGVYYKEIIPGPDCAVMDVITQPFDWVVMPKYNNNEIQFFKTEEIKNCGQGDCEEPLFYMPIDEGSWTGHTAGELVFTNNYQFTAFWNVHKPGMEPPPINFEEHMVLAMLIGARPTSGYFVETKEVCLNGANDPAGMHIDVKYIENIPGPDCIVEPATTKPYQIIVIPRFDVPVNFHKEEVVYDCPGNDCMPVDFWPVAEGHKSCEPPEHFPMFHKPVLQDVWNGIYCNSPYMPPIPEINWDLEVPFIIQLGNMPTTGYYITLDYACVNAEAGYVEINYTLNIPGPGCDVAQIETQPWIIGAIPWQPHLAEYQWNFIGNEFVYECQPCEPVPFYEVAEGNESCGEPGTYGFYGFGDLFMEKWYKVKCYDGGGNPPMIPEYPPPVMGGVMKPFIIQAHDRPTTGYYITIDSVCVDDCTVIVDFTVWEPGPDCPVEEVITQPWVMGVYELLTPGCEPTYEFHGQEQTYECGGCEPVPFYDQAAGQHGCADPGAYGFQFEEDYDQFWYNVNCWNPDSGDPPPPFPPDPEPINDGIIYHMGIQLPGRPSTGYFITVDEVCVEGCDVYVEWTEHIPGENCDVLWVGTHPWATFAVELPPVYCAWNWHFTKHEEVYICEEQPCFDFLTIAGNNNHGGEETGGYFLDTHQSFYVHWYTYHANEGQMPPVNWENGWGAYCVHDGVRPTTGWEVEVFEVCPADDPFGVAVRWMEWIPGETCPVDQVETAPWTMITMPLVDMPYFDQGFEEIYQCD